MPSLPRLADLAGRVWSSAAGALFPPCCCACGAALAPDGRDPFCGGCRGEAALIDGAACRRCAAPVGGVAPPAEGCPHCAGRAMRFDAAVAAGVYEGLLRRLALSAKHATGEGASVALGRLAAAAAVRSGEAPPDVVTCVPMHWRRRVLRRHNSPESMGGALAREVGAPFEARLLAWRRVVRKQSELSMTERRRNVRGALAVRPGHRLEGAGVWVVDDILTTGATCSDAARALKLAGAVRVVAVVATRSL